MKSRDLRRRLGDGFDSDAIDEGDSGSAPVLEAHLFELARGRRRERAFEALPFPASIILGASDAIVGNPDGSALQVDVQRERRIHRFGRKFRVHRDAIGFPLFANSVRRFRVFPEVSAISGSEFD